MGITTYHFPKPKATMQGECPHYEFSLRKNYLLLVMFHVEIRASRCPMGGVEKNGKEWASLVFSKCMGKSGFSLSNHSPWKIS